MKKLSDQGENKIRDKMRAILNSADKDINDFFSKAEEKINSFDEEKFNEKVDNFFVEMGKCISTFFVKVWKCIAHFFVITVPKIIKALKGDTWGIIVPFLLLILILIIAAVIATTFTPMH